MIPQDFIDDLIARADIVEVLGRRIQLKKAGREFKACCPFHDEKNAVFHGESIQRFLSLLWLRRSRHRDRVPDGV